MKHLILFSGGYDTTSVVLKLLDLGIKEEDILCLYFRYNSVIDREEEKAAISICNELGVPFKRLKCALNFGDDCLLDPKKENKSSTAYVPYRNLLFLARAINYFEARKIFGNIYFGTNKGDMYKDSTKTYMRLLKNLILTMSIKRYNVEAPFIDMQKKEYRHYLDKRPDIKKLIYYCYLGKSVPCGQCESCQRHKETA